LVHGGILARYIAEPEVYTLIKNSSGAKSQKKDKKVKAMAAKA